MNLDRIAIDMETCGLSPVRENRIIEISGAQVIDGTPIQEFGILIHCDRPISAGTRQVHGIDSAMPQEQPGPEAVYTTIHNVIMQATLATHNALFDQGFLRYAIGLMGWPMNKPFPMHSGSQSTHSVPTAEPPSTRRPTTCWPTCRRISGFTGGWGAYGW